jgi:molybdenum cofactor sulfurtransferase
MQIKQASPQSLILVDTAAYCSTSIFDLSKHPDVDMIVLSFYKLFGFPTGVGCLVVKTSVLLSHFMSNSSPSGCYFGGGSILGLHHGGFVKRKGDDIVQPSSSTSSSTSQFNLHERFEHGTLPFLEILAVDHGFNFIESLPLQMLPSSVYGWAWLESHVNQLANLCRSKMRSLMHYNRQPVCVFYPNVKDQASLSMGPIINFNLTR